ncbi:MAG: sensor histidine kinase KdpD [Armatimonadetes bacterium]|nr:sensor histidine kinase KdpD [Armatimonadota bacterium]
MSSHHDRTRPDPDLLLDHIGNEEQSASRGRLKVFLGYAAGVGKTFMMLQQGHWRQAEGVDVVIGYVETHGRAETEALVAGLEVLSRRSVAYQGATLTELDVDAVLDRHPQLVLVDELAHTNAPGGRHDKRFQDVEEILAAGIDVYTTVNIQHLESLNDTIAQITGIVVRETIPDHVLDSAHEIELVDLPPDDLLQRLQEGRVYVPEQAARALERFFRKGNLTALREIALRRTASRVDDQLRSYMQTRAIAGPWAATERLLVCVGPSPLSARLLRTARRLAQDLKAEWLALYVETSQTALSPAAQERLAQNLRLAEQLGAQVVTISATTIAEAVASYARAHNVTKIIVGKPLRSRLHELLYGSIVDQIIRATGMIDVYVISSSGEVSPAVARVPTRPLNWLNYARSVGLVAAATLVGAPLRSLIEPTNLVVLYLAAVLVAALYLGRNEALLASILGTLAFDFFCVPPHLTFAVADTQYLLTFAGLFGVGLVISSLAARARAQAEAAQRRQSQALNLYELSRALAATPSLQSVLKVILDHIVRTFDAAAAIFLPGEKGLHIAAASEPLDLDEDEFAVATWSWQHGEEAGPGTDTLNGAAFRYLPLRAGEEKVGVLAVRLTEREGYLPPDDRRLLESAASLAALAVERIHLAEKAGQAELLRVTENLQSALLNSISHDLRTPLASITGVLSSLTESDAGNCQFCLQEGPARELVTVALGEAERLNHLVGNLLDMSRLEAGALRLHEEPSDLQDLVGAVLTQVGDRLGENPVTVDLAPDLPLVPLDFVLIAQVLTNLLDNAAKYAPAGCPIEIGARSTEDALTVTVADRGPGIPDEDLDRVFDKFHRVMRPNGASGTGLGLAISRGIIEAHGGRISAHPRDGGGLEVQFSLPLTVPGGED